MNNESPNTTNRRLTSVERDKFIEEVLSHGFVFELGSKNPIEYALYKHFKHDEATKAILQGNARALCSYVFHTSCYLSPKQWTPIIGSEPLLTVACVINWDARYGCIWRYGPAKFKNALKEWNKRPAAWRDAYSRAFARDIGLPESVLHSQRADR